MTKEQTGRYAGGAELWLGETKLSDVKVDLVSYAEMEVVRTAGQIERVEGLRSWEGRFTAGHTKLHLEAGERYELKFPDGRSGDVLLLTTNGALVGASDVPFG